MRKTLGNVALFTTSVLLISGCQSNSVAGYFSPIPSSTSNSTASSGGTITPGPVGVTSPVPGPTIKPIPTPTPTITPTPKPTATATPSPTPSPSPSGALVCNPLGNGGGSTSDTGGLIATLSYFPFKTDPSTGWEINTIGNGIDLADFSQSASVLTQNVFFNNVDVPSEHFTVGFPDEDGVPLKVGTTVLDEYFSLDFKSQIVLGPNDVPGNYQFLTLSDDGSIFSVDTGSGLQPLISADGEHSSEVACAAKTVAMTASTKLPMELHYFQGPHDTIAMIVMWRFVPAGGSLTDSECNKVGGDSYYFNETTLAPLSPYNGLLARGWKVLANDNYELPAATGTNPCLTDPK
jgi:hypothetical protein